MNPIEIEWELLPYNFELTATLHQVINLIEQVESRGLTSPFNKAYVAAVVESDLYTIQEKYDVLDMVADSVHDLFSSAVTADEL